MTSGKETRTLARHVRSVYSLALSPDGKALASGSDDSTVKLWEAASGKELRKLVGHPGDVFSAASSPDDRILASGDDWGTLWLWGVAR